MAFNSRVAGTTCIYWDGRICTATSYFSAASISCYNGGKCNSDSSPSKPGTCLDCSRYDVGGLKLSTVSYTDASREKETSAPRKNDQTPMNVAIINMVAKIRKCCYWNGPSIQFKMSGTGVISPALNQSNTKCTKGADAVPWQNPGSATNLKNISKFPCNGFKSSCPYYTGPKFEYLKDEKLEFGQKISAAQIMELRYYSRDWTKYANPRVEYEKAFSTPSIWAWAGGFDDTSPTTKSIPKMVEVSLFKTVAVSGATSQGIIISSPQSFSSALTIGAPVFASKGTVVSSGPPAYPTLIKQLADDLNPFQIKWPLGTSAKKPFVFRTFRIGLNTIQIIVAHNSSFPLYAVNVTKFPQGSLTDEEFVSYMLEEHQDDIYTAEPSASFGTIFNIELLHNPELNEIKVYTSKESPVKGSMYTDTAYVKHMFYHGFVAQTSFEDKHGMPVVEPWIDRFLNWSAKAKIFNMSRNQAEPSEVLWDSMAYDKKTIYEVEKILEEDIEEWNEIQCNIVALTIKDLNINPVQAWKVSGSPAAANNAGKKLGITLDRSSNPASQTDKATEVEMELVDKSPDGSRFPANIVFAKPKSGTYSLDKRYDKFRVVIAYTEYKQGPIPEADRGFLKYPQDVNKYIPIMPYKVDFDSRDSSFEVSGLSLPIVDKNGEVVKRLSVKDFESVIAQVEKAVYENEKIAIESFAEGGTREGEIENIGETYRRIEAEFNADNAELKFEDGTPLTLFNLCAKLENVGYYEGTQEYRVVFKDEEGRPIGIKRLYFLMQSAVPSCRDVEIYYQWTSKRAYVDLRDHVSLLARDYNTMLRSDKTTDVIYTPDCGDHNVQDESQTFYEKLVQENESILWTRAYTGDLRAKFSYNKTYPGAMWYPYKACRMPRYREEDPMAKHILCSQKVEGFGFGKRRAYWEATRGQDVWTTTRLGIQSIVGCTWSWVEGDLQTVTNPVFAGFTRIRSGHLFGAYQTDREALRLSRHYIKRNLKVEKELVRTSEGAYSLTSSASTLLFDENGEPVDEEKPIWIHLTDGFGLTNRTSPLAEHPFAHLLMDDSGSHAVTEQYQETRKSLKQVFESRELVKADDRNEGGALVFDPSVPKYQDQLDEDTVVLGKDVLWVYKDSDAVWAWMEKGKDPDRAVSGSGRIGGVTLYQPSLAAWKKDLESATYTTEGEHDLVYTPPKFDEKTGDVSSNPQIKFAGGPPREIEWISGTLKGAPSSAGKDPYEVSNHNDSAFVQFAIFGKTTSVSGTGFLADSTGRHIFENPDGDKVGTFRGVAINPNIVVSLLPYEEKNLVTPEKQKILDLRQNYKETTFELSLKGYKAVSRATVEYKLGEEGGVAYSLPQLSIDGLTYGNSWVNNIGYFVAYPTNKNPAAKSSQTINLTGRYKKIRLKVGPVPQRQAVWITDINITVREPVARTEKVKVYEQKLTISTGNNGNYKASDLYYFYGRTFTDFGLNDVNYAEASTSGPVLQDLKWMNRSVRDVMVMYHFMDPTGTLFDYPNTKVSDIANIKEGVGGAYYVDQALDIHTKGQTVVTSTHVSDPIDAKAANLSWSNTVAKDEVSQCPNAKSEKTLDRTLQECLYNEAASLLDGSTTSTYRSFWHPDEESFFTKEAGVKEMPSWTLELKSFISPFNRVMRHPGYGCSADYTNEYHDGRVHNIPAWRALGHLLYLGNVVFNFTCTAPIMNKVGLHIGEKFFEKRPTDYVSSIKWPPPEISAIEIKSSGFYLSDPKYYDNPNTYTGGVLSAGIPIRVSQAMNYAPGGVPRNWLTELAFFPQTRRWPISSDPLIAGLLKTKIN